jgi:hypothetical protein
MVAMDTGKDEHFEDGSIWQICIKADHGSWQKIVSGEGEIILWVYTRKYSAIASGATPIGTAEHAPNDIIELRYDFMTWRKAYCLWAYTQNKFFDYSLRGYSHRECWAHTRRCFMMNNGGKDAKRLWGYHYSHRERVLLIKVEHVRTVKQGCDIWFSSCVIATKLECHDWNISWR